MERNQRRVRDLRREGKKRESTQALLSSSAFCIALGHTVFLMGGKGGRKGKCKARAPRWVSAVPGDSPWIMWSPCDIPELSGGMPEVEPVHLFPRTPDSPQGMEDVAQDSDEGKVTGEPMEWGCFVDHHGQQRF